MPVPPDGPAPQWAQPYPEYHPDPRWPPPPPPPRPTNGLAVAALVCGLVFAPLGIVFGHLSLAQIKRTGEDGRGLAVAGLAIGYVLTALFAMAAIGVLLLAMAFSRDLNRFDGPMYTAAPQPSRAIPELPRFAPPADLGADCRYPASGAAARPAQPPRSGRVPTVPATVDVTIDTSAGAVGVTLDNAQSPCTVNSFVSLAQQGYFDDTPCHRLTANRSLSALQCGDPSGTGTGGPGYEFADEYPANQYPDDAPALREPVRYPRGTVAMANAGVDTNGSQFFILYADSALPPTYTVFGSIDDTGLTVIDRIADDGVQGGNLDGAPNQPVTIESVRLD